MFDAHFDERRRRLSIRYSGFLTDEQVTIVLDRFRAEIADAASGGAFTLLEDFRDFSVQQSSVIDISQAFTDIIDRAPVARFAMVINSALLKGQLRRQAESKTTHVMFARIEDAGHWLAEVEPR